MLGLLMTLDMALGDGRDYNKGDVIPFFVNTIGPYANPSEVYSYYTLPVCAPDPDKRSADRGFALGEQLEGDEFKKSLYVLKFQGERVPPLSLSLLPTFLSTLPKSIDDEVDKKLCEKTFKKPEIDVLKKAIDHYYFFELLCGKLLSF